MQNRTYGTLFLTLALLFCGMSAHAHTSDSARTPRTHTVKGGETLSGIAKRYGISVEELKRWNRLKSDRLYPGDRLRLKKGGKLKTRKKAHSSKKSAKKRRSRSPRNPGDCAYTVQKGDSLWKIAKKKRTTISKLRKWNPKKHKRLRPGRVLKVCKLKIGGGPVRQKGAVQLPAEGPGFEAPRRRRVWGQPHVVRAIEEASAEIAKRFPGTQPLFIGDLSFEKGGYMPPHKSHRSGLDADISFFLNNNPVQGRFRDVKPDELDAHKTWIFIEALLRTGVVHQFYIEHNLQEKLYEEAARLGYSESELKRIFEFPRKIGTGRTKLIRHIKGHDDHLHVRFNQSPASKDAQD